MSGQRVTHREDANPGEVREYRRDREHLYPLEDYQEALAIGSTVTSFCGIEVNLLRGDAAVVVEATEPGVEDCITCVDVWRQRRLVRL
ncbi:hypothetical protein D0Z08_27240 [Nocardioides immobilis]|uniref:DUF3039 domain-containing protein n=1 Tax=Nocardioides immobilis TaxID=2049295 RepID=A0A417XUK8_9ACTN|nr:hypothetical protein [Nocardioides immobilis]RHW23941.1 hypothetical protein D0Z08_27240 [Nocardioides immobilis]